ncbi:MAG: hypothetical protein R3B90_06245 [Planctomycetaceae bacterium]
MLGLRQREGIDLAQFQSRYGLTPEQLEPQAWRKHIADGRLEVVQGRLRLTTEGCFVADRVMSDFL